VSTKVAARAALLVPVVAGGVVAGAEVVGGTVVEAAEVLEPFARALLPPSEHAIATNPVAAAAAAVRNVRRLTVTGDGDGQSWMFCAR
jgi:hypothetical protein